MSRNQRTDDYTDSYSSSRQTSPGVDKLLDIFDPDILDKSFSDDFLTDTFSWTDYADPGKLSSKLYAPPGASKPNIPKLKVDTNQIKSNSAMAVFEFDDPEEGRRAKEEERMRLMRTGSSSSGRKNKRKITKSPSQASTPKVICGLRIGKSSQSPFFYFFLFENLIVPTRSLHYPRNFRYSS